MSRGPRPPLEGGASPWQGLFELVAVGGLGWMVATLALCRPSGPIPRHFGFDGEVDAWGGGGGLWALPVVSALMWLALTLLDRRPDLYNYAIEITADNAQRQYRLARLMIAAMKAQTMLLFGYLHWVQCEAASGAPGSLSPWLLPAMLLSFAGTVVVYLMHSLRQP